MLFAYLDESGLDSDGSMFVTGHIGNPESWLLFDEQWRAAMGAHRASFERPQLAQFRSEGAP
jgi:hypothetical protein